MQCNASVESSHQGLHFFFVTRKIFEQFMGTMHLIVYVKLIFMINYSQHILQIVHTCIVLVCVNLI